MNIFTAVQLMVFLIFLSLITACAPKIDCRDTNQMLSPDKEVRRAWLKRCTGVNRKVKVTGAAVVEEAE